MSGWTYADDTVARRHDGAADAQAQPKPRATEQQAEPGSVIAGRYELQSYLGKGRYGEVHMALDRALSEPRLDQQHWVALHLLHPQVTGQPQLLQTLENTYHHPHLWSHPNVVKVRGFGADRGQYFLVTELLAGVSLRSILDESPHELLPEDEACAVLRGVGDALKYAHAKGVIHGEVRPEKVFITEDYAVKVLDLLPTIPRRTVPFFAEDTPELAAPDRRDDVYGLACIAYELFSGQQPYNANSPLEAVDAGLTLAPIEAISMARWAALVRGLALRRDARTPTVADLMTELGITGAERLRPAISRPAAAAPDAQLPNAPRVVAGAPGPTLAAPARRLDDDVPVLVDSLDASRPWAPSAPPQQPAAPPPTVAIRSDDPEPDEFGYAPERWARRRFGPGRRRGARFAAFAAIAAVVALVVYSQFEEIKTRSPEWLAAARTFVADASRDRAERAAPAPAVPVDGEESAVANGSAPRSSERTPIETVEAPVVAMVEDPPPEVAAPQNGSPPRSGTEPPARSMPLPAAEPLASSAAGSNAPPAAAPEPAARGEPARAATSQAANGPETIELAASSVVVSEAAPAATIVVRRRGGALGESSFAWWTSDGTARAGDDYANLGARIEHFAAGEESRTLYVPLIRDSLAERRELFYVDVRGSDQPGRRLDASSRVEIAIVDDD
jgi:serine/threonine protein kinase